MTSRTPEPGASGRHTKPADLLGPLAIGDKTWIVFVFDDPATLRREPFSLVLPDLPEMRFTRKKFTEWSVGR